MRRKRWLRITLSIILILVVAVGIIVTLVPISPRMLSKFGISLDEVLVKVEIKLGRKVSIEDFRLYLLRGGTLENIEIANHKDFSKTPFFKTDKMVVKYALLPLIHKEIVIKKVVLVKPQILIERDKEGQWSFSDLVTTDTSVQSSPLVPRGLEVPGGELGVRSNSDFVSNVSEHRTHLVPSTRCEASPITSGRAPNYIFSQAYAAAKEEKPKKMAVTVSSVAIQKGRIIFNDEVIPQIMSIEDIDILVSNISQKEKADFDISLNIPEEIASPLKIKASLNPFTLKETRDIDARIDVDGLDLVYFAPYYQSFLPGKLQSAKLNIGLDLGLKEKISAKGKIALNNLVFIPTKGIPLPIKFESLAVDHDLGIDLEKSNIDIEKLNLNLEGISFNAKGEIKDFKKERILSLSLCSDQISLEKAKGLASSFVRAPILKEIKAEGTIDLKVNLKGKLKELEIDGVLNLNDDTIKYAKLTQPLSNIKSSIKFDKKDIAIPRLSANLGSSTLVLKGRIINFRKPELNLLLTSDKLVLNELANIAAKPGAKKGPAIEGIASLNTKITGPTKKINLAGDIGIPKLKVDKLELSNTDLNYSFQLAERLLNIKSLKTNLYQGSLNTSGSLNLSDPKKLGYALKTDAQGIDLNELLAANTNLKDKFYGTLGLDLEIKGKGTDKEALEKTWGKGYLNLADGKITGIPVQKELIKFLLSILQIPEIKEIHYDSLSGHFNLAGGEVKTDDFLLDGKEMKVLASGSYFLDGGLDFDVMVKPTPFLIGASPIPPHLKDERGNAVIPFRLTGTTQKPKLTPKWEKMIEKAIKTEAEKQLEKAVGKEGTEAIKEVIKGVEDLFKKK
ncbi:AsmA family protein [bacterium]|nr:AsmA family protein [bacterium]